MLLLDTSYFSALIAEHVSRQTGPAKELLRTHAREKTVVSLITVAEYLEYAGAPSGALDILRAHSLVGLSLDIARRCALLQSRLSRRLGENDAWLAATALHHNFTLVTADKDFNRVPRLKLIHFVR